MKSYSATHGICSERLSLVLRPNLTTCRTQQTTQTQASPVRVQTSSLLPGVAYHRSLYRITRSLISTMKSYVGCSLLLFSAALAGASLAEMVFRCPSCTAERQALCPKLIETCAEIVREPGCGCCPVCARQEGELCGVYTPRCSSGLRCYPKPDSELPLEQLVQGQGLCGHKVDTEPTAWSLEHREHTSGQFQQTFTFLIRLSRLSVVTFKE